MRRTIATVALAVVFAGLTACSTGTPEAQSSPSTTIAATPTLAGVAKDVTCKNYETLDVELKAKMVTLVGTLMQAAASEDEAKAKEALGQFTGAMTDYHEGIEELQAEAGDAEAKAALEAFAAEIKKAIDAMETDGDVETAMTAMDDEKITELEEKFEALCK